MAISISHALTPACYKTPTHPDTLHVERDAVRRDALVVRGLEHVVLALAIDEPAAERPDLILEFVSGEHLVRQAGEAQVEEIREAAVLQALWLRQAVPNPVQVRLERRGEVREWRRADVVADNEEKECTLVIASGLSCHVSEWERTGWGVVGLTRRICQRDRGSLRKRS